MRFFPVLPVTRLEIALIATLFGVATSLGATSTWAAAPPDDKPDAARQDSASKQNAAAPEQPGAADDTVQPTTIWMKKKLDYAQQILGGIAEADYDRIAKNAASMKALGRIEGFVRGRTPGYRTQLQIFQDATDELLRQAEKENVDGAALAFTQLTISCVNCHKQLRESLAK